MSRENGTRDVNYRPERLRRSADGACVASVGSCGPGPTFVPVRSVGRGNVIGRDLGDFAASRACSERSRRRSVLRGRLTAARPERGTKPFPHRSVGSAPIAGLSEARFGRQRTTNRAILTVSPNFATRFLSSLLAASPLGEEGDSSLLPVEGDRGSARSAGSRAWFMVPSRPLTSSTRVKSWDSSRSGPVTLTTPTEATSQPQWLVPVCRQCVEAMNAWQRQSERVRTASLTPYGRCHQPHSIGQGCFLLMGTPIQPQFSQSS